jgi:hypothetical protein
VSKTTIEDQLAKIRHRIEQLHALGEASDRATYVAAVTAELESWDTYLERLQTTAATRAWYAREQAEAEIRDARRHRIAAAELLLQVRNAAGNGWQEHRERVSAASDELAQKADELTAKLS